MQRRLRTLLLCGGLSVFAAAPAMAQTTTLTRAVATGTDDAEECVAGGTGTVGAMDLTSSDLEIVLDGTKNQMIGVRFANITIPQGATIVSAYIQFATKGDKNATLGDAVIRGEAADASLTYTATAFNITSRALTADSVLWPGSTSTTWGTTAAGTAGPDQKTPDLKNIIQAIVNRAGWVNGNALSIMLKGAGVRNAYSYDGASASAPKLIVEYSSGTTPPPSSMPVINFPIPKFAQWRYLDNGVNMDTIWRVNSFVDTSWAFGPGKLGYSDNPATTLGYGPNSGNKYITYYFRKPFNVASVAALSDTLELNLLRDDGAIVYINNKEVVRSNMPAGAVNYMTFSSTIVDGADESTYFTYHIPKTSLVNGTNIIAVEIHQRDGTSSDLGFDMELKEYVVPPVPTQSLLRGPYLMVATPTSMNVRWRTTLAAKSVVRFGTAANALTQSVIDTNAVTEHEVKLAGLAPHTKYWYSVGSLTDTLQGDTANYFMTVRPAGDGSFQRFGVIGDCGNNSTNQKNVRDQLINYLGNNYMDSWILLGDNAYSSGTDAEFQAEFFNIYKDRFLKQNPLYPAPGNHDYQNGNSARQNDHAMPYYSLFSMPSQGQSGGVPSNTQAFYSFNNGNVHFLSLDSYGKEDSATRLYDTLGAQVQWIKADLAANQNKGWVVAYWHHPPYTMGSHNSDTETELVRIRENFIRILERMGVDLILCGHSHDYERSKLMKGHYGNENSFDSTIHNLSQSSGKYDGSNNSCPYLKDSVDHFEGTVYVVSGSAGQLGGSQAGYPHNAMAAYSNATNGGAMVLEVEGNRLDAKWICADGTIRDKFTLMKNTNFNKTYTINEGDSVQLTAGFNGNRYNWTGATDTTKAVWVKPADTANYVVKDIYDCVTDSFTVNVIPKVIPPNSVGNVQLANDIILAPNPSRNNEMAINLKKGNALNAQLRLSDASGRVIFTKDVVLTTAPQRFLPDLHKGIYILSVITSQGSLNKKVVIE